MEEAEEAEEATEGEGQTRDTALCDRLCLHEALCDACIMFESAALFSPPTARLSFLACACLCVSTPSGSVSLNRALLSG